MREAVARAHLRLGQLLSILLFAFALATTGLAQAQDSGETADVGVPEIPKTMTAEEAFRFVGGLTDAQARLLVLRQIDQLRAEAAAASAGPSGLAVVMVHFRMWLEAQAELLRERLALVGAGVGAAPDCVATLLRSLSTDGGWGGFVTALASVAAFLLLGLAARFGVNRLTSNFRASLEAAQRASMLDRLCRLSLRALLDLAALIAFAIVSLGLTAIFYSGDPLGRAFVSGYVTAALLVAAAATVSRFFLAPGAPSLRLVSLRDEVALFLHRNFVRLTLVGSFVWLTTAFLILNGRPPLGVHLTFVLLSGGILLAMLIAMVWQARMPVAAAIAGAGNDGGTPPSPLRLGLARHWHHLATGYILVIAALWAFSMLTSGKSVLWAAVGSIAIVALLPAIDRALQHVIRHMVDALLVERYAPVAIATGGEDGGAPLPVPRVEDNAEKSHRYVAVLTRGVRVVLIVLAAIAILQLWQMDVLRALGAPGASALWGAAFNIAATALVAVVLWQLAEAAMTRKRRRAFTTSAASWDSDAEPGEHPVPGEISEVPEDLQPQARAQTLLPLIRKFILIVLLTMVTMIALSSIGVNIGPLLAGAGVVGLAIGFGAQSLVRDVVAGVFFLIDDAFRVGEYVEFNDLRGEVEAISLRSIRLRHHRGAVITVPFGEMRHITNYNRDWVIYKMPIRVEPDTDPEKVKKIIKQIGKEMMEEPELGPKFIEPLKSQGVFAIDDDSALIIRVKFMSKPREQFVLRREAYHRIRKAFAAHGIEFARRKVEVMASPDASAAQIARAGVSEVVDAKAAGGGTASTADAQ